MRTQEEICKEIERIEGSRNHCELAKSYKLLQVETLKWVLGLRKKSA